ncbi:helix-turn-helix domain-containing protein [Agarilytica rhodophyticola]|uniref:helix-turn-helix domain-containing protein n=1 Tax=Agarilytica rhodophyticola TaxID=1737490 RepID=UPI000B347B5B|nr:helix-turn-helix domain-containing protein [Agarilytica rhodophyticola]
MIQSKTLDIGTVAKYSGLPSATLRFYEEKGLIKSTGRKGLRRLFDAQVLERLALISLGRSAGFSLQEIAGMLTVDGTNIDRQQLSEKADELDKHIRKLTGIRDGLRHAAKCSAPSHLECPTFQRLLRIAVKQRTPKKNKVFNKKLS